MPEDEAGTARAAAAEGESVLTKSPNLGDVRVRVEKVRPQTYVAYRWTSAFPGGKTRLRVVESGFAGLSGPRQVPDAGGWTSVFDVVEKRVEEA
ncbi:hypothetical protein [Saccharothrix sp. NRRL B-16348]|uniref:hypothetical protein n=1 Tax=Saccharothrix sp. NRRL B-16348 TaxID=1415542 RepID=UPI0006ADD639|nr:hypothetical protein [Saccharothrix sp. NRRL B-16348]